MGLVKLGVRKTDGEYKITVKVDDVYRHESAYFTNDMRDAVHTARELRRYMVEDGHVVTLTKALADLFRHLGVFEVKVTASSVRYEPADPTDIPAKLQVYVGGTFYRCHPKDPTEPARGWCVLDEDGVSFFYCNNLVMCGAERMMAFCSYVRVGKDGTQCAPLHGVNA